MAAKAGWRRNYVTVTLRIMRHMRTLLLLSLIISTWLQTAAAIMG